MATLSVLFGSDLTATLRGLNTAGFSPVKPSDGPADIAARSGRESREVPAVPAGAAAHHR